MSGEGAQLRVQFGMWIGVLQRATMSGLLQDCNGLSVSREGCTDESGALRGREMGREGLLSTSEGPGMLAAFDKVPHVAEQQ